MADDFPPSPDLDTSSNSGKKGFGNFWAELRRRKVFRVAITYPVLPFDNRSKLEDDECFTDGIHDDLLTQTSKIKDIKTQTRNHLIRDGSTCGGQTQ